MQIGEFNELMSYDTSENKKTTHGITIHWAEHIVK